jgi:hypothetical protein
MVVELAKKFKALSDHSRLRIIASLSKEPMYVELISKRLNLHPSTVSFHLKKLEELKIVSSTKDQYYTIYKLHPEELDFNVLSQIIQSAENLDTEEDREKKYRNKIISAFIKNGKLVSIPVQQKKRLIILEEIAKDFVKEKKYPEKEVNLIIKKYHEDFCTIRREFIMNKLFTREQGVYQKK